MLSLNQDSLVQELAMGLNYEYRSVATS